MFKKISLLILILLFVGAANVFAFELVDETKTKGFSVGTGIVLNSEITYYFQIAGDYKINDRLFIKGVLGVPYPIE